MRINYLNLRKIQFHFSTFPKELLISFLNPSYELRQLELINIKSLKDDDVLFIFPLQ